MDPERIDLAAQLHDAAMMEKEYIERRRHLKVLLTETAYKEYEQEKEQARLRTLINVKASGWSWSVHKGLVDGKDNLVQHKMTFSVDLIANKKSINNVSALEPRPVDDEGGRWMNQFDIQKAKFAYDKEYITRTVEAMNPIKDIVWKRYGASYRAATSAVLYVYTERHAEPTRACWVKDMKLDQFFEWDPKGDLRWTEHMLVWDQLKNVPSPTITSSRILRPDFEDTHRFPQEKKEQRDLPKTLYTVRKRYGALFRNQLEKRKRELFFGALPKHGSSSAQLEN